MRRKDGAVSFKTSPRTHEEILAVPEEHRRAHERIYLTAWFYAKLESEFKTLIVIAGL